MQVLREKCYCESLQQTTGIRDFRWEKINIIHEQKDVQVYTLVKYNCQRVPPGERTHSLDNKVGNVTPRK